MNRYIQQQLNLDTIAGSPILLERLAKLDTIYLIPADLFQRYNPSRQVDNQNQLVVAKKVQQQRAR